MKIACTNVAKTRVLYVVICKYERNVRIELINETETKFISFLSKKSLKLINFVGLELRRSLVAVLFFIANLTWQYNARYFVMMPFYLIAAYNQ